MDKSLAEFAKAHGVKYFLINFTDLSGVQRSKLVPAAAIDEMQSAGAGYLDMTPAYPDLFGVPDAASVGHLPWRPEVAWVASDLMIEGAPVPQAPRVVLKNLLARAEAAGYRLKTGVEAEYMLLSADGAALSDPYDTAAKPCYDQQALMRRYDVIAEICDAMGALGWGP